MFDAEAFAATLVPWSFRDAKRRVWTPRELSAPETAKWQSLFVAAADDVVWTESLVRRLIRHLFPFRPRYWWTGDPYRAFMQLASDVRAAALRDFFRPRRQRPPLTPSGPSRRPNNSLPSSPTPSPISAAAPGR